MSFPSRIPKIFARRSYCNISFERIQLAKRRDKDLRAEHNRIQSVFPIISQGDEHIGSEEAYRKRLLYRSKQRGWLEVDLLMGTWAKENIYKLSIDELKQYDDILGQETIDIFNLITNKAIIPENLNTPIMKRLQEYCLSGKVLAKS